MTGQAIGKAAHIAPPGPLPESLRALIMDPILYTSTWVLSGLAVGILYLMTNKPETVESVGVMVLALVVAIAGARLTDKGAPIAVEASEPEPVETRS